MANVPALCIELKVHVNGDGTPVVNSRDVATHFEKRHADVLRDIDNHLANADLRWRNWFREVEYIDEQGKARRSINMTRDGFSFLVHKWTGEKAANFTLKYIDAFNAMEEMIRSATPATHADLIQSIREIVAPLAIRFDGQDQAIERIERRQDVQADDIAQIKQILNGRRRKPTPATIADHVDAIEQLGGRCPIYPEITIVENGERLPFTDVDHFFASHMPDADHTWLISRKAHNDLTYGRLQREDVIPLFEAYQIKRRRLPGRQPRMF